MKLSDVLQKMGLRVQVEDKVRSDYEEGQYLWQQRQPWSACSNAAQREGWDDAEHYESCRQW